MATKKPVAPGANPASDDLPAEKNALLGSFCETVWCEGDRLYRDLPWRRTRDPYAIWVSEVMLQQTQVARVDGRWQRWLERFPDTAVLADADAGDVLEEWQGLGYNRRALSLARAARMIEDAGGEFPREERDLVALPGIGPATAAGIRAFAFDLPGVYLETNVRTVFLHELFPDAHDVPDSALVPLVREACPGFAAACGAERGPRAWYYALLDYGACLKQTLPNPSPSRAQKPSRSSSARMRSSSSPSTGGRPAATSTASSSRARSSRVSATPSRRASNSTRTSSARFWRCEPSKRDCRACVRERREGLGSVCLRKAP